MQSSLGHLLQPRGSLHEDQSAEKRMSFVSLDSSAVRIAHNVLSACECAALREAADSLNFSSPQNFDARDRVCERVHTVDPSLSIPMMHRLRAFVPEIVVVDGVRWRLTRFTHHWRFVRYYRGGHFAPHYDGSKLLPWQEMSMFTVQIYLNSQGEDFTGGATRFYMDYVAQQHASHDIIDGQSRRAYLDSEALQPTHSVQPRVGDVLIFDHAGRSVFHDAEPVLSGSKYILRGDLLYAAVEDDYKLLQDPPLPVERRKWCPQTAAVFGTRDFTGQRWTCKCAKDHHGAACKHGSEAWQDYHTDTATSTACSDTDSIASDMKRRVCILVSGKRASGKDYASSALQRALEAVGLSTVRCSVGSINKRVYAATVGIDAQRLETDREFKENHRLAMVDHHKKRNSEDQSWCLNEVWQQAEDACADVLLLTDFRTQQDYRWFLDKVVDEDSLICLRIEASAEARLHRGWLPDQAKDGLYSEIDLDAFVRWSACFDNSSDESMGLLEEWVSHTVLPRVMSQMVQRDTHACRISTATSHMSNGAPLN